MNNSSKTLPRHLAGSLRAALRSFPVVVLTGARQTGKSTLIRSLEGPQRDYRTLDDLEDLERADREPRAFLSAKGPVTVDEVQRSPSLLLEIKREVDRNRKPGRFLLSGSANLLLMGKVSESLAGRAVYKTLHPFTFSERVGQGGVGAWSRLLDDPASFEGVYPPKSLSDDDLTAGGLPLAALAENARERVLWLGGYVQTYLERDLQTLSAIENLADFRRLMRVASLRSGQVVNQSEMARDAGLKQPTVHRYLNLLETSHLLHRLPVYSVSRTKRVVKTPKLYMADTGLAAYLAGITNAAGLKESRLRGALLENAVLCDLLAWREGEAPAPEIMYWRTQTGDEVDFVVERDGAVVPIEVKSTSQPRLGDAQGLQAFLAEHPKTSPYGILLHGGTRAERLADRVWSVPLSVVLGIA